MCIHNYECVCEFAKINTIPTSQNMLKCTNKYSVWGITKKNTKNIRIIYI